MIHSAYAMQQILSPQYSPKFCKFTTIIIIKEREKEKKNVCCVFVVVVVMNDDDDVTAREKLFIATQNITLAHEYR